MTTGGYDDLFRPDDSSRAVPPRTPALPPELSPRAPRPAHTSGPNFRRIGSWVAGITSLIVLGVSGIGYTALNNYNGKITREDVFAGIDNPSCCDGIGCAYQHLARGI